MTIYDDFSNSSPAVIDRIREISGSKSSRLQVVVADVRDTAMLTQKLEGVDGVVHFAAFKAVGESVEIPLDYYDNNLSGTVSVLKACIDKKVPKFVFSSSATVYGYPEYVPIDEAARVSSTNPYGRTKEFSEWIVRDCVAASPGLSAVLLRYFNPIGAHPSGIIGEDPRGLPNNLVPYVSKVAVGELPMVRVWGNDYETIDGTGVRDYIHVMDLARAHVKSLETEFEAPCEVLNLGTGTGYSVLQVIAAYEQASGRTIPYEIHPRRAGDVGSVYADPTKAREKMGWNAELNLAEMCRDSWNWQRGNPRGYATEETNNN